MKRATNIVRDGHDNPLGTEKVPRLIVQYSAPAILGMVISSLYNFVDRIFIGNSPDLGPNGLAGITIGFPLMIILMAFGILFGIGGSTLFSIRLGENRSKDAETAMGNAYLMLIVTGIVFLILGQIFLRPLLTLFGASETVMPYAVDYMRIIFFGATFQIGSLGMNNFVRADGSPRIAMATMILGAVLNILLDPLFIFVLRWGMQGAALATVLAQALSFFWVLFYFRSKRSQTKIRLQTMRPRPDVIVQITKLGLPGFLMQLSNSVLTTFLNRNLLAYGGDIAISGMGIIHSLQMLFFMPVIGLKQGLQPIISFNYGAGKFDRVRQAARLGALYATIMVTVFYLFTRLFPQTLVSLFTSETELIAFGSQALLSWFLCMPLIGFQIIGSNYFQAIGRYRSAMVLTLTRQVIILIPAVIVFPRIWGLIGLLHAAPFADLLATLLTGYCFFQSMKTLGQDPADPWPDAKTAVVVPGQGKSLASGVEASTPKRGASLITKLTTLRTRARK